MAEALCQGAARSIATLLCDATKTLRTAGIENPRAEARLLLSHSLGLDPTALIGRAHDPVEASGFAPLLARRAAREPIAYILGTREFWGKKFRVTPATLIPRPETETLVEAALDCFPERAAVRRVLDLGTGSGCLLCTALAEFPAATGLGVDASEAALAVARFNAESLGLGGRVLFVHGDWLAGIAGKFDLVLANPPYVALAEMARLEPELGHEPLFALVAGEDGLDAYRAILPRLGAVLAPGGVAILELGAGQAAMVAALAARCGLQVVTLCHDLARIPRAIVLSVRPPG